MWQMSSVFSHESAQRNDAGHLIDKNVVRFMFDNMNGLLAFAWRVETRNHW